MDPFQRLPAELVCQVVRNTDFVGVDGLVSVSLAARAVFQANSRAIIRGLVSSNSITSHPEVKKLLSNIALIHDPSICCTSLDEYMQLTNGGNENALESTFCRQNSDLACRILRIAAQTQRLACICLLTLRQGLVTALGTSPVRAQKANEPFSYLEEYRVYWAIWQLKCYSDLRKAVDWRASSSINGAEGLSTGHNWIWSRESINKLDAYTTFNEIHDFRAEQIWTVASVLAELGAPLVSPSTRESLALQHPSTVAWDLPPNTPIPFFSSFQLAGSVGNHHSLLWCPPQTPIEDPVTKAWHLTLPFCHRPSAQTMLFRSLRHRALRGHGSRRPSAIMEDISPYRRSGVLLWDSWRMYSIRLMPSSSREGRPAPGGGFIEPDCEAATGEDIMPNWFEIAGVKQRSD
ncbi:hypothetical protein N7501_000293 [Penicillium viridicatum]|nr:hypothetical protein N7501_000293 [Penicillium viridicatum]